LVTWRRAIIARAVGAVAMIPALGGRCDGG